MKYESIIIHKKYCYIHFYCSCMIYTVWLIISNTKHCLTYMTKWINIILQNSLCSPYSGSLTSSTDIAYRIVADHARMMCVSIADGIRPSNIGLDGLKYVMNRYIIHFLFVYVCVCHYFISYEMQNSSKKKYSICFLG